MCTQCHAALAAPAALAQHAHHDPAGEGGRCVGCHMPRIVYGVLDVHRSHRIDVPAPPRPDAPAGAGADARPDACTLCHLGGVPGGATGVGPLRAVFAAAPVGRAVAADALGRAPPFDADDRARRLGALLAAMEGDAYPAVRHLAWRGLRRLIAPGAAPGAGPAAAYDPSADAAARARLVAGLRRDLGAAARDPDPRVVAALGAAASQQALEIGE
jgi:hypothetical protein